MELWRRTYYAVSRTSKTKCKLCKSQYFPAVYYLYSLPHIYQVMLVVLQTLGMPVSRCPSVRSWQACHRQCLHFLTKVGPSVLLLGVARVIEPRFQWLRLNLGCLVVGPCCLGVWRRTVPSMPLVPGVLKQAYETALVKLYITLREPQGCE